MSSKIFLKKIYKHDAFKIIAFKILSCLFYSFVSPKRSHIFKFSCLCSYKDWVKIVVVWGARNIKSIWSSSMAIFQELFLQGKLGGKGGTKTLVLHHSTKYTTNITSLSIHDFKE